jgi:hypothetical protein
MQGQITRRKWPEFPEKSGQNSRNPQSRRRLPQWLVQAILAICPEAAWQRCLCISGVTCPRRVAISRPGRASGRRDIQIVQLGRNTHQRDLDVSPAAPGAPQTDDVDQHDRACESGDSPADPSRSASPLSPTETNSDFEPTRTGDVPCHQIRNLRKNCALTSGWTLQKVWTRGGLDAYCPMFTGSRHGHAGCTSGPA